MLVRKPLVLAMLAAGIIASDGLPEAQSTVFVPELAMLDGALCTGTMATTPFQPLLLAQMKTEVSPAAKAAASAAPVSASAEQPLIAAVAARYNTDPRFERPMLDEAYAGAMASAAAKFPDDLDILAMYAESLMDRSPWNYWQAGGTNPNPVVAPLVPTLETVLKKDPNHIGAIHLYIHAVEASADAKRAEAFADKLAKLAPNAGHLVHMPAHIYYRLGRYKDSLA